MALNKTVEAVTKRIIERSQKSRRDYMGRMDHMRKTYPNRAHLSCGNIAHVAAACSASDKEKIAGERAANLAIITAYNDMLSAHQPFEKYPDLIRDAAHKKGASVQVAGGVPAMCDGVTQGQPGMELSLFSRDIIAMSAAVGLSHNCFDAVVYLGVCDKIIPGLVMAAATFGHLPSVFLPAGPMPSGLENDEKARIRKLYAKGEIDRAELLEAEMSSYHSPGTCTFYGTANTNQFLMEMMGLHLPASAFVNPNTDLRTALTKAGAERAIDIALNTASPIPVCDILDERAFVNAIVGLHATGGSTNLVIHLCAMARAAGVIIDLEDLADLSTVTPLLARVYPNGMADVNHFHAAGGSGLIIAQLLNAGLLHPDVQTVMGKGLERYTQEPYLDDDGCVIWKEGTDKSLDEQVIRPTTNPFAPQGGLANLRGNLGNAIMKISAVSEDRHIIEAPVAIFHDQHDVKAAFENGELDRDVVVVVRFQGPKANGMPELHSLTPVLSVLQDKGFKVALLTDGRMSGASGKVPAAIHLSPEAEAGGPIARLQEGDIVRLDATTGALDVLVEDTEFNSRPLATCDLTASHTGLGRELFGAFRQVVTSADQGASVALITHDLG
jgi:phosphogluconate dehydratase